MEPIDKTVFISYRRTNFAWAMAVWQNLTQNGYDVFIDYQGIASGDFESAILENIRSRAHFLLILTPSALERCDEPGDWLRREIETAIASKRNIVPIMLEGFSFSSPAIANQLTGTLAAVKKYNALGVPRDYFLEAMERLRDRFVNVPLAAVIHPPSVSAQQAATEQNNAAKAAPPVGKQELTAQEYFERGLDSSDSDEQISFYSEAIRLNGDYVAAYYNRANARREKGDLDRAFDDYTDAIRLWPAFAEAYNNRALVREAKGDLDGAVDDYTHAILHKPNYADAYSNRGSILGASGDLDRMFDDYDTAIRLNPSFGEAFYNRGIQRAAKGDLDGAIEDYGEAARLMPEFAKASFNRAVVRETKGDLDGALSDYNETIRRKPDLANTYYNRGLLLFRKDQHAAAIADFQKYIDLAAETQNDGTEQVKGWIRELQEGLETKAPES